MVQWHLTDGIKPQINGLVYGFEEVMNVKHLEKFDPSDLELALCGTQDIDLGDWRSNTEYRGGYFDSHDTISLFWDYIAKSEKTHIHKYFDVAKFLRYLKLVLRFLST